MVCIHRSFRDLGLGTSSSHSDTTSVVVGAVVGWGNLGVCLEGLGVALAGAMDWRLGILLRLGVMIRVGLTSPSLGSNVPPYSGRQEYPQ